MLQAGFLQNIAHSANPLATTYLLETATKSHRQVKLDASKPPQPTTSRCKGQHHHSLWLSARSGIGYGAIRDGDPLATLASTCSTLQHGYPWSSCSNLTSVKSSPSMDLQCTPTSIRIRIRVSAVISYGVTSLGLRKDWPVE